MIKCYVTGKEFSSLRGFLNHFRTVDCDNRTYYDTYLKVETDGICANESCDQPTRFRSIGKGYNKYCCFRCLHTSAEKVEKVKNRFVNNPSVLETFRAKLKSRPWVSNVEKRQETIKAKALGLRYLSGRVSLTIYT